MRAQVKEKETNHFRFRLKDHAIIMLGLALALVVMTIPLQLYMPLGRYQHYGLSVFVLGMSYLLQLVWSWPRMTRWPRAGYAATGLYLASIGLILYANPWLDARAAMMTMEKEKFRRSLGWIYTILALPLAYIYFRWMQVDYKRQSAKDKGGDP